jgi:hypothetical protein
VIGVFAMAAKASYKSFYIVCWILVREVIELQLLGIEHSKG